MKKSDKIFIAGHNGLVGDALMRILIKKGYRNIVTINKSKLDLCDFKKVNFFFKKNKINILMICAAKVGGILSNDLNKYEFLSINLKIQTNLLECAKIYKLKKVMFMGSSCIYPKFSKNPIKEEYILSGSLEKTNEAYALSKIVGLKYAEYLIKKENLDIRCFMPCNLFGYKDKFFDDNNNHVIPSLIKKIYQSKIDNKDIIIWGNGKPKREFLHADDLAYNIIKLMKLKKELFYKYIGNQYFYNIGSKQQITIKELAIIIKKIIKSKQKILFDKTKPNGTLNKFLSKLKTEKLITIKYNPFKLMLKKTIYHFIKLYHDKYKNI